MNSAVKLIFASLILCILSIGFMQFIDRFILTNLADWTMSISNKYLIFEWTLADKNLVRCFPVIIGILGLLSRHMEIRQIVKRAGWVFLSLILSIFLGIIIALMTWTNDSAPSDLLPDYLKFQPFTYYWTIFILVGIALPLVPIFNNNKTKPVKQNDSSSPIGGSRLHS